jgi:hypothetical protein
MKNWVAAYYPGTKIGITEYNWGAESTSTAPRPRPTSSASSAAKDWIWPRAGPRPPPTRPLIAMKMYRNYDGNKSAFGDTSVAATVPNPDNLSAFAAIRTNDSALTVMVINKTLTGFTPLTLNVTNFANSGTAQAWQLTASNVITRLADVPYTGGVVSNQLPAQSITLFVLPTAQNVRLRLGTNAAPRQLELWLDGPGRQDYILQSSTNLTGLVGGEHQHLLSNSFRWLWARPTRPGCFIAEF